MGKRRKSGPVRGVDAIANALWRDYVRPFVGRSLKRTRVARKLFSGGPPVTSSNPLVQSILVDGRGMDGTNAALMTWGYLASLCRIHERRLKASRV
jgi:hypothetical protein